MKVSMSKSLLMTALMTGSLMSLVDAAFLCRRYTGIYRYYGGNSDGEQKT